MLLALKRIIYTVTLHYLFTECSCKGALDGLEKGELFLVWLLYQGGLEFLLTMRGSVYIKC